MSQLRKEWNIKIEYKEWERMSSLNISLYSLYFSILLIFFLCQKETCQRSDAKLRSKWREWEDYFFLGYVLSIRTHLICKKPKQNEVTKCDQAFSHSPLQYRSFMPSHGVLAALKLLSSPVTKCSWQLFVLCLIHPDSIFLLSSFITN